MNRSWRGRRVDRPQSLAQGQPDAWPTQRFRIFADRETLHWKRLDRRGGPPRWRSGTFSVHCLVPDSTRTAHRFLFFLQRDAPSAFESTPGVTPTGRGARSRTPRLRSTAALRAATTVNWCERSCTYTLRRSRLDVAHHHTSVLSARQIAARAPPLSAGPCRTRRRTPRRSSGCPCPPLPGPS